MRAACWRRCASTTDVFLNDVSIGPDGAAYFTNSNAPQIFRVALEHGRDWTGDDVGRRDRHDHRTGLQPRRHRRLTGPHDPSIVAQGNVGMLWRFDLASGGSTQIDTGDADLTNADGLVLRGGT